MPMTNTAFDPHARAFLRGLLHAARNVMQRSQTTASFLRLEAGTAPAMHELLDEFEQHVTDMNALFVAARNHIETPDVERGDVSLKTILGAAWEAAPRGDATMDLDAGADATICGDAALLTQLFEALFRNALEAPADNLEVSWAATMDSAGLVRIDVRDNGPGFTTTARARAFEPFWSSKPGHVGLGLAWAAHILSMHGGHVAVAQSAGPGGAVEVHLPAAAARP